MANPNLNRFRPDPAPAIHPVPEYLADVDLNSRYEEAKTVLRVPWMGVVMMAFAHYPTFYDLLWQGVRPLCLSGAFVSVCRNLRALVEERVSELNPPTMVERLAVAGYAPGELDTIRDVVEVFSHGNYAYFLIATIARELLEGVELRGSKTAEPSADETKPASHVPLVLMEMHHADLSTRALYEDVKATLGLPFVNTDYRALGRWPSYFHQAWSDLKPTVGTNHYEAIAMDVHRHAINVAASLPNPEGLHPSVLREAAARDASLEEVLGVVRLFQWLLPGLMINVAFFRQQLVVMNRIGDGTQL
jgi:hypothetical protein